MTMGTSSGPTEPEELARLRSVERSALEALDAGNFDRAVRLLIEVVTGYETIGDPLLINSAAYYLGVGLAGQGKLDRAAKVWEEIIEEGWDSPAAYNRLVRYYESCDRSDDVARLYERLQRAASERTGQFFAYPEPRDKEPPERGTAEEPGAVHARRLLIADDEPSVCDIVERVVKPDGFTVLRAEDGQRALRLILTTQLDVIVLDYFLPGYTGLDVLYRIRAENIDQPVLMISGRHDPQIVEDATRLGATWLGKPFDHERFAETVRRLARSKDDQDTNRPATGE